MEKLKAQEFTKKMVDWLTHSPIQTAQGAVYSWINPDKEGYVYSEIIGYYIKFNAYLYHKTGDDSYLQKSITSANYICETVHENGSVGRAGYQYVFDTAICMSGFAALAKVHKLNVEQEAVFKNMSQFVYTSLKKKEAVYKNNSAVFDKDRWSLSYGSLLIKNAMALHEAADYFGDHRYKELSESMVQEITDQSFKQLDDETGYFAINGEREFVYTHPHCYATEGLLFLTSKGYSEYEPHVKKAAAFLAKNQNEDGSMHNWHLKEDAELEKQGDATSQAVRIWQCVDKENYASNISKGMSFLESLQHAGGGLGYNFDSENQKSSDENSWVTMFAAQAGLWQTEDADRDWII